MHRRDDDMMDIYGPQCGYGIHAGLGGLKKTMWMEIQKEFNSTTLCSQSSKTQKDKIKGEKRDEDGNQSAWKIR